MRTIAAANAASALGVGAVIEGFAGQTTRTTAGIEAGWASSMISWSPERVMAPLEDLQDVREGFPERLVVGTGSYGRMRPDPAGEHRRPTAAALRLRWQSVW